jgi:hypothetical protein
MLERVQWNKVAQKFGHLLSFFKSCPKMTLAQLAKIRPIGENSPNLVTVDADEEQQDVSPPLSHTFEFWFDLRFGICADSKVVNLPTYICTCCGMNGQGSCYIADMTRVTRLGEFPPFWDTTVFSLQFLNYI